MIRSIFFDFGGTLADEPLPHAESYYRFLQAHGIEASRDEVEAGNRAMEAYGAKWAAEHPDDLSKTLADRYWYNACLSFARQIKSVPDAHDLAELMHANHSIIPYRLYDDTLPALDALASAGFRMGIISNWDAPTLDFATRDLGIRGRFVMVLSSRCAQCEKPRPEIFHEACRRAGVEPTTSVMVGDNPRADVEGAQGVGMKGILIDRGGANPATRVTLSEGCLVIHRLTELPFLLNSIVR